MKRALISRVLLLDDHATYRRELRDFLEGRLGVRVVGETDDPEQLLRMAERLEPDAVLVDLTATRLDGIAATRALVALNPDVLVIALSLYGDSQLAERALAIGAAAFVTRGELVDQLPRALRALAALRLPGGSRRSRAQGRTRSTRSRRLLFSRLVAVP